MSGEDKPSKNHPSRKHYNWLFYDIMDQHLIDHSQHIKGSLYDLGCGEMPYKEWLLQFADTYTGVDWSNTLHRLKADIVADLNEPLPLTEHIADTAITMSVMEHLREPQLFLGEAFRILKPGGVLILQVPFLWGVHEAPHDYYRYTKYGLEYMLSKAGFTDIEVYSQTGFWVMWTLKFNYQISRLIRGPWPLRKLMATLVRMVWFSGQIIAPRLDRHWVCDEETAGYHVVARKAR